MIDTKHLELNVLLDASFADTSELDGVSAKLGTDGKSVVPLSSETDVPDGIIHNPQDRAIFGDNARATFVLNGAPYIQRVNLGDTPEGVVVKTKLALKADGTVKKATGAAGEVVIGVAIEPVVSASANQRVRAIIYSQPVVK